MSYSSGDLPNGFAVIKSISFCDVGVLVEKEGDTEGGVFFKFGRSGSIHTRPSDDVYFDESIIVDTTSVQPFRNQTVLCKAAVLNSQAFEYWRQPCLRGYMYKWPLSISQSYGFRTTRYFTLIENVLSYYYNIEEAELAEPKVSIIICPKCKICRGYIRGTNCLVLELPEVKDPEKKKKE